MNREEMIAKAAEAIDAVVQRVWMESLSIEVGDREIAEMAAAAVDAVLECFSPPF